MVGVKTNVVTSVEMTDQNGNDCPQFVPLVASTAQRFQMAEVSADKAYLSKANLALVESRGAVPFIPFKSLTVGRRDPSGWVVYLTRDFCIPLDELGRVAARPPASKRTDLLVVMARACGRSA